MNSKTVGPDKTPFRRELALFVIGLSAVLLLQIRLAQGGMLFTRHFWLDEIYTYTLVADPSLEHAHKALAGGVETHPPALYLSLRLFTSLVGRHDELALRAFAFLAAALALVGLYRILRLSFPVAASVAGVFAVWCHPVLEEQSFEARFYAPWLAAIVWYAYLIVRSREGAGIGRTIVMAFTAVYVCTVHYFGIITLLLVVAAELAWRWTRLQPLWTGVAASSAGPLALALCVPTLLQQRAATTIASWIKTPEPANLMALLGDIYLEKALAIAVLIAWIGFMTWSWRQGEPQVTSWNDPGAQVGISALLALPFVLIVFSYVVQPAVVNRYSLAAVAGIAPAVGWLFAGLPARWAIAAAGLFVGQGAWQLHDRAIETREKDQKTNALIASIEATTGEEPVLFESPAEQYIVCRYDPKLLTRSYLIDFEKGELGYEPGSRIFVRDLARQYAKNYAPPSLMKWSEFHQNYKHAFLVPAFLHVADTTTKWEGPYPGFFVRRVNDQLYELIAKEAR